MMLSPHKMSMLNDLGRVLVVGLGITGLSVVRFLSGKANVAGLADDRVEVPKLDQLRALAPAASVYTGSYAELDLADFDTILLSPGVPRRSELVLKALELGLDVIGDIELFARVVEAPVVGVTGSNGKSTVVHLLTEMAKASGINVALGGNFGVPALDLLEQQAQLYVLELSSFQLESTQSLKTVVSVVLNITPDHMDRYESVAEYAHTKARIYNGARTCLVNRDDALASSLPPKKADIGFGLGQPPKSQDYGVIKVQGKRFLAQGETPLIATSDLKIVGRHNQSNALAALALGDVAGLNAMAMLDTLKDYRGLDHRTQWVAEQDGVLWINDSKATNTGATMAALSGMECPVILIAGGQGKGADFAVLNSSVAAHCREVILLGEDAATIASALEDAKKITFVNSMEEAVQHAADVALRGDCVMLSPACASFDMYRGYAARGADFMQKVRLLGGVVV